ncbi:NitT/TauT family transport system ATP-binding protein [Ectothiorhodosinus mongolicus]|uniref:NitT/TauT family transport system ATP-binding protein n=1 Tax=Ectothiorhodosinus mongolicus TaxID=233100 RepID=A0A1R3W7N7_9GAMM|nr:ABC transporter ATP-binding protein [Ectothiorhodosinus mongolicus]ULX57570.1 nitrate ABC transporter ATP-binding protein [Ectothiorhodosinus mongolicus]SIT72863.1 NitT/TauT family transport system ATP-binding protein [Ectothiorhodosinus mongolicus]
MATAERIIDTAPEWVQTPKGSGDPAAKHRPHITIRGLKKTFKTRTLYENFSLDLPRGKITTVFGPNGCGKSTLINMVSGLLPFDQGEVLFDGKALKDITFGYVFQNYREALFPWMRARDNIAYPLRIRGMSKAECDARVDELAASFEIGFDLNLKPFNLSGGQQQLVSIMRALAPEPEVLFLDEPFSALDYEMTLFIRDRLQAIFMETGITMIVVSHDLEEAVFLADEVLLLSKPPTQVAEIIEVNSPRPRNDQTLSSDEFVATKAHCLQVFQREVRR